MNSKKRIDPFLLPREKKEGMVLKIKDFFLNEREEEVGDLGASLILDFFISDLAEEFYNLGVSDSHNYMNDRVEDLLSLQKIERQSLDHY